MSCSVHVAPNARRGFTLVELMVVMVILSILGSLMLAGLNVARKRAKIEKTRGTIGKLQGIVSGQFASYAERSTTPLLFGTGAPIAGAGYIYDMYVQTDVSPPRYHGPKTVGNTWPAYASPPADMFKIHQSRLSQRRLLMTLEMPDSWSDVRNGVLAVTSGTSTIPPFARTGTVRGYAAYRAAINPSATHEPAECLYMVVARSGFDPYAIEQFRSDEVGDTDGDNAPEFLDSWGNPIIFLRWAPGFTPYSQVQVNDPGSRHDPMDPQGVDAVGYTLVPLIASGGEDGLTGLQVVDGGWLPLSLTSIIASGSNVGAPDTANPTAYRDNITNHAIR